MFQHAGSYKAFVLADGRFWMQNSMLKELADGLF